jgi:hypothetical protein
MRYEYIAMSYIRIKANRVTKFWEIDFSDFAPEITCDEHCYACTVNR